MKNKFFLKIIIEVLSMILLFVFPSAIAKEKSNFVNTIKDTQVQEIIENSVVLYQDFYQAMVYGEKVFLKENDKNCVTYRLEDNKIYVPKDFLDTQFQIDSSSTIQTKNDVEYISIADALEKSEYFITTTNEITIITKNQIDNKKISDNSGKIARLFGIFVSPIETQGGNGTLKAPYNSLESAKQVVTRQKNDVGYVGGEINVYIRGGLYTVNESIKFEDGDSGYEDCKIIYEAYKDEKPTFDGGITLKGSQFSKVTSQKALDKLPQGAKDKAMQYDLSTLNFSPTADGVDPRDGEVYYNLEAMQISRWPNFDYALTGEGIKTITSYFDPGISFVVDKVDIDNWKNASDAWTFGFWVWDWDGNPLKVKQFDTKVKSLSTIGSPRYSPLGSKRRYYVYNLLEELDCENEYYIDRESKILYIFPYASHITDGRFANDKIQIPMLNVPMFKFDNACNIEFKGLTMENTLSDFMIINGGKNIDVTGCIIRNSPQNGVIVQNGAVDVDISSCDIYNMGRGAVTLDAGNRQELIAGNSTVKNCRLFNSGRIQRTNCATLSLKGYKNTVSNCEIFNAPHSAVSIMGNDLVLEYCEIYNALTDKAHDAGAVYQGRSPTNYGNIIRYNYFHDIYSGAMGVVYHDDHLTGYSEFGNIFYNTTRATFIHGGQYQNFNNNLYIYPNSKGNAIYYQGSSKASWDPSTKKVIEAADGWDIQLNSIDEKNPKWLEKYPEFNKLVERGFVDLPYNGEACNNVSIFKTKEDIVPSVGLRNDVVDGVVKIEGNYETTEDIGFVDMENLDFTLKEDAPIFKINPNFEKIPFEKMGIYKDTFRKETPKLETFDLIYPINLSEEIEARDITFRWQKIDNTIKYKFILATDRDFNNIIRDIVVEGNSVIVKNLRYGKIRYFWKVIALSPNTINISMEEKISCDVPYYSFTTKKDETLDIKEALLTLDNAKKEYENCVEGENPGEYFVGVKDQFNTLIKNFDDTLNQSKLSQRKINSAMSNFNRNYFSIKGKRNSETLLINDMLKNYASWSFQENKAYMRGAGITWTRGSSGDNISAGYKAKKLENYQTIKFKATLSDLDGWMYFGVRASDTLAGYSGSNLYFVVIKENIFELQKRGEKSLLLEYPNNGIVKANEEFLCEIGAIDKEDGSVQVVFKINDQVIIDYNDNDAPIRDQGYFVVYMPVVNKTLTLMPVE